MRHSVPMLGPFSATVLDYEPRARLPCHHHAPATLSLILAGGQLETVGSRQYECPVHSAVLKGAGVEHANQVGAQPTQGLFVEISAETAVALCDAAGTSLDAECFSDGATRHLVRRIGVELRLRRPGASLIVEGLLFELLGALVRGRALEQTRPGDLRLQRAMEFLEANFQRRLTVAEVAAQSGIHPSYLAELFRSRYATSVGEWVRNRRLEFARDALRNPAMPISGIAIKAGFADQSHLTRLFRARFGVTPAEYRSTIC
ncbi:MAG TPA: AraC family transcriptional regulator [Gemmatimonadales bacterium]|nr:AraC family transcriptional regulator [Gemmatimonadales bacterium]